MIDLHCHILPGIDDGAKTIEESIEMARKAVSDGITTIVATPHHKNGTYDNEKSKIMQEVENLNNRLKAEGIELTILPGQEVRIYGEIADDYRGKAGRNHGEEISNGIDGDTENGIGVGVDRSIETIQTYYNTPYILIELPSSHVPRYTGQVLFDLQVKGLKPIIAHPERNSEIINHPNSLYHLVEKGFLTQVTAASVTGHFGKKIQRFSFDLIEAQMAHFIASDAHNVTSRTFNLSQAYEVIEKEFGIEARYYFQENAQMVVNNQTIYAGQPERIKKKKFLGIF